MQLVSELYGTWISPRKFTNELQSAWISSGTLRMFFKNDYCSAGTLLIHLVFFFFFLTLYSSLALATLARNLRLKLKLLGSRVVLYKWFFNYLDTIRNPPSLSYAVKTLYNHFRSVSNFVSCRRAIGSTWISSPKSLMKGSQSAWISSGTLRTDFKMIASLLELYKCIT